MSHQLSHRQLLIICRAACAATLTGRPSPATFDRDDLAAAIEQLNDALAIQDRKYDTVHADSMDQARPGSAAARRAITRRELLAGLLLVPAAALPAVIRAPRACGRAHVGNSEDSRGYSDAFSEVDSEDTLKIWADVCDRFAQMARRRLGEVAK